MPVATAYARLILVAAITLTSVFSTLDEPTLRYSPFCSTLNSRACVSFGSSPISSRNNVPPLASSKYPFLSPMAPVNAPFSCPNNSALMVPSGMAPQFTARYFPVFLRLFWCIILGMTSLPTPLSPVISTARSVGATANAVSIACVRAASFPMISNLFFILCNSCRSIYGKVKEFYLFLS